MSRSRGQFRDAALQFQDSPRLRENDEILFSELYQNIIPVYGEPSLTHILGLFVLDFLFATRHELKGRLETDTTHQSEQLHDTYEILV